MDTFEEINLLGFVDEEIDPTLDLFDEIEKLKKEKNAVILAHYYQDADIQDIADYIGVSLGLSQQAAKTDADIIVFAGVHFMAETAKILSPTKKVLLPDVKAGCSLADSCPPHLFKKFKEAYPDHLVITYVNCTAELKAMSDIVCTSSNAIGIVESLPKEQKIIFGPDKNLLGGRVIALLQQHVIDPFTLRREAQAARRQARAQIAIGILSRRVHVGDKLTAGRPSVKI